MSPFKKTILTIVKLRLTAVKDARFAACSLVKGSTLEDREFPKWVRCGTSMIVGKKMDVS